jgi:hypothetical protein
MSFDPFDHRAFERLEPQWRQRLFDWAAKGANVPVGELELCETEMRLKTGRVIARLSHDRAKTEWRMVGSDLALSL